MPIINTQQLIFQLKQAEPVLAKVALAHAKRVYFEPAVQQMNADFENHKVTQEIAGGIEAENISRTMVGIPRKHSEGRNLFSFIGFNAGTDPLRPIRARLKSTHEDGPKISYVRGSQVNNLIFSFLIQAPNESAIFDYTPAPRFEGSISWAERIEMGGIPGINQFLNRYGIARSKSGGGIQVEGTLPRNAYFKTVPYLKQIFGDFLARFK